jgi:hypothetical protein
MNKLPEEVFDHFKKKLHKFYETKRKAQPNKFQSLFRSQPRIAIDAQFVDDFLQEIEPLMQKHGATPNSSAWHAVVTHLKNEAESRAYSVDYLNIYHTFLAWAFAVFCAFAFSLKEFRAITLTGILGIFIIYAFPKRADLRRDVFDLKTLLNIFEYQKALPLQQAVASNTERHADALA